MENNKYKKRRNRSYELIIIGVFLIFVSCDSTLYDSDIQKEPNINSDILIENSLTFYDGSSYSDLEIVRNAERMQNDLSEIYDGLDRKSTRLNSSHVAISYAVFCLKKKT